jgi:hypothetical protein
VNINKIWHTSSFQRFFVTSLPSINAGYSEADEKTDSSKKHPNRLYRYRKFALDKDATVELLVRTSVDAWEASNKKPLKRAGMPNFVNIHCLNEWNPKYASGIAWNKFLEKQIKEFC